MARVTPDEVKAIISMPENFDFQPFIMAATSLVDNLVAPELDDQDLLKEVERWLAAHFSAVNNDNMTADSEDVDKASIKYQYKVDLRLDVTMYGQQAMILDTSGALARHNQDGKEQGKVNYSFNYLGET